MRYELDGREYKLLLNPDRFSEASLETIAEAFWHEQMKPLIDRRLGLRDGSEPRYEARFDEPIERMVRFWDTPDCILTRGSLALRERVQIDGQGSSGVRPEITLKLRMADLFVVAATDLRGSGDRAQTSFEEDIAPLEVDDPQPGKRSVVVPNQRSIRSRFSRSTTQTAEWSASQRTLAGVHALFPTIFQLVETSGMQSAPATVLVCGPTIRELVVKGARVKFGAGIIGKFALTLWYFGAERSTPDVAEISFKCATIDGDIHGNAARRALNLFVAMQTDLGDWVNSEHSSKTALALPDACRIRHG
ncbi:hypothetical protein GFL38_10665 [Rhizobium leguminosarum bv. viciae]|uniref:hypothetical protein n=1 Tax=Rhizobium ruizarguesonis TaxID=2081791 RepID=UPI00143FA80F|nr:hypothetical protein [Rhizobium ruizarguesonis]NKJ72722.1 hypothetical protein [Rhizobium leguminosarum bv. viciae]NKQ80402.1 hypothetical protein [Rhizobium ruizarguesonis]